jgi:hypothetical protein
MLIASVMVLGQGGVWYSGQFWALYSLQTVKKVDVLTSSSIVGIALLIAWEEAPSRRLARAPGPAADPERPREGPLREPLRVRLHPPSPCIPRNE